MVAHYWAAVIPTGVAVAIFKVIPRTTWVRFEFTFTSVEAFGEVPDGAKVITYVTTKKSLPTTRLIAPTIREEIQVAMLQQKYK